MYADQTLGKYQLIAEIARGGMGVVYLALLQGPGGFSKLVVIKELKVELAEDPAFLTMFLDEARLAARLNHPNIVQTNEVGSEGHRHFMAMDYLDGRTYERVRRRSKTSGNPFTLPMQLKVFCDVLGALDYAHQLADFDGRPLEVVHRDVSPNNVFVTFDGHVRVLDFGIAKAADHDHETIAGAVKGKISYMAPEQARGERVDARADVFSVGVMLWEAVAGKRLRGAGGQEDIVRMIGGTELPRLSTVVPDVAPALEAIVARAVANHRDHRYGSAAEMLAALESYLVSIGGPPSARELATVVTGLFVDERAKVNQLIETHIKAARANAASTHPGAAASLPVLEMTGPAPAVQTPAPTPKHTAGGSVTLLPTPTLAGEHGEPTVPALPRRSRGAFVALGAAAAIAIVVALVVTRRDARMPPAATNLTPAPVPATEPVLPPAPPTAGPATASPSAAAAPELAAIDVEIRATPRAATLAIDDAEVPGNPFRGRYRADGLMHRVRASAPGYADAIRDVAFAGNITLELALTRESTSAPSPRPRPAARTPAARPAPPPAVAAPGIPAVAEPRPAPVAPTPPRPEPAPAEPTEINPAGGQKPRRSIDAKNPYGTP